MTNTKLRRLLWLATALAVLVLSAAGCSGGDSAASSAPTDSYAQSLYNSRVQYIGDNAAWAVCYPSWAWTTGWAPLLWSCKPRTSPTA